LLSVLEKMSFGQKWIQWIRLRISTVAFLFWLMDHCRFFQGSEGSQARKRSVSLPIHHCHVRTQQYDPNSLLEGSQARRPSVSIPIHHCHVMQIKIARLISWMGGGVILDMKVSNHPRKAQSVMEDSLKELWKFITCSNGFMREEMTTT